MRMEKGIYYQLYCGLVYGLLIVDTASGNECGHCDCCAGACNVTNNYTCDAAGCKDGYYGIQCLHRCLNDPPCLSCGRTGGIWCFTCNDGYYVPTSGKTNDNTRCTLPCNERCTSCIGSQNNCPTCNDGYANIGTTEDCSFVCPPNCETCSSSNVCSGCKPGFYNVSNNCRIRCAQNCSKCNDKTACTECKPGFFTQIKHNIKLCNSSCPFNCYKCTADGCDICKIGYYNNSRLCLSKCSHGCTSNTCDKETGECPSCWLGYTGNRCDTCVNGKYGSYCNLTCPANCKGLKCQRIYGNCTDGCSLNKYVGPYCDKCVDGIHGVTCDELCPSNCNGFTCFKEDGKCSQGCNDNYAGEMCEDCIAGRYGDNCTEVCPSNCLNETCDQYSGKCLSCKTNYDGDVCDSCKTGYYGELCNQTCSSGCLNNICNRTDGTCTYGCSIYFSGDKCCLYHKTGVCMLCSSTDECSVCETRRYGKLCNNACSNRCIVGECEIDTGYCNQCPGNMYGPYCEHECPENCHVITTSQKTERICTKDSGDCIHGCKTGFFGFRCNSSCSQNCANNTCAKITGWCTEQCIKGYQGPTCTEGVGRTGTYIALDKLTKAGNETGEVNVVRCVMDMREQRAYMIQTFEQYEYLHKCLVYTLTSDCGLLTAEGIASTTGDDSDNTFTKLYQMLNIDMNSYPDEERARDTNMQRNTMNRPGADIPGDKWRPRLFLNREFNDSDYINAVYLNSFTCTNRFIIAQTPLPETMEDFLTLVYQSNVTCVVSLDDILQCGTDVGIYQSPGQVIQQGLFTISSEKYQSSGRAFAFGINFEHVDEKVVSYFQFSEWTSCEKVPKDPASLVKLIKLIERTLHSTETEQCILVHCLTGAERCGLFCAVSVLLEKQQLERHVSVLNTLRQIRVRRKTAIPYKEQLKFCFQCLAELQDEKDIYYNV